MQRDFTYTYHNRTFYANKLENFSGILISTSPYAAYIKMLVLDLNFWNLFLDSISVLKQIISRGTSQIMQLFQVTETSNVEVLLVLDTNSFSIKQKLMNRILWTIAATKEI